MGILSMGILYHGIAQLFHMDIAHEESDVLSCSTWILLMKKVMF